jgi:hypothetical protein
MLADVGDTPILTRIYQDDDGDLFDPTTVTATLKAPDGTTGSPWSPTRLSLGTFQAAPFLSATGEWVLTFTAVGPADVHEVAIFAKPVGETAPWAPDLRKVGSHIPSRTRDEVTNDPLGTFTETTNPSGRQVDSIIASAVAAVAGMVGRPIVAAAFPLCETAAALWAAYWTELAFPERDSDVSVYARLRDDALLLTKSAAEVNQGAGGGTVDPPGEDDIIGLSSYCFPAAPREYVL